MTRSASPGTLRWWFALSLCLAACKRRSEAAPPPPPSPAPPAPPAQPAAPAQAAPPAPPAPPAPTAAAPGVLCTATPASSFHLRPTATLDAEGPELPARTPLGVLSLDEEMIRRSTQMFAVKVLPDGPTGHVFLGLGDVAADCPPTVRAPLELARCQDACAAPHRAGHDRCLNECTNSGERGSECLDSCQVDAFTECMRARCNVEYAPRMW